MSYSTYNTLSLVLLIVGLSISFLGVSFMSRPDPFGEYRNVKIGGFLAVMIGISCIIIGCFNDKKAEQVLLQSIDNGYTIYFDGEEVDVGHIDIFQYSEISVNDEKNAIYIKR